MGRIGLFWLALSAAFFLGFLLRGSFEQFQAGRIESRSARRQPDQAKRRAAV